MCDTSMWEEFIRVRSVWCNEGSGVKTYTIKQNSVQDILQDIVQIYYLGSIAVKAFDAINISHIKWLNIILQFGVSDKKRDVRSNNYGITKQIIFGWTQK